MMIEEGLLKFAICLPNYLSCSSTCWSSVKLELAKWIYFNIIPMTLLRRLKRVPIINPPFADTAGIYTHPTPENKRKAAEVLASVFGGGSEKVADGQREERTGMVTPMSGN